MIKLSVAMLLMLIAVAARGDELSSPPLLEAQAHEIKIAFVFNMAKLVQWPEDTFGDAHGPIRLGFCGPQPLTAALQQSLTERKIGGRPVAVVHVTNSDQVRSCHVVFVREDSGNRAKQILKACRDLPILTITELEKLDGHGSIINFIIVDNKVRFELDLEAAKRAGLTIDPRLIRLATRVARASGGTN